MILIVGRYNVWYLFFLVDICAIFLFDVSIRFCHFERGNKQGGGWTWVSSHTPAIMTPRGGSDVATMGLNCKVEDVDLCDKTWMWCLGRLNAY